MKPPFASFRVAAGVRPGGPGNEPPVRDCEIGPTHQPLARSGGASAR